MEVIVISLIKISLVLLVILTTVANLVWVERRVSAFIQNRLGPNRVGPWGLFQSPADVAKLFLKEDIVPARANRFIHTLAPIIFPRCFGRAEARAASHGGTPWSPRASTPSARSAGPSSRISRPPA